MHGGGLVSPAVPEAAGGAPPRPPLVGREPELARFGVLLDGLAAGRGDVVVVSGEAGIGKSRLAAEALSECRRRGFAVFTAGADEVQTPRPFGLVVDALGVSSGEDRARQEIMRWLDGGVAGGFGLEARIAELLVGLVEGACEAGPVALVLDDMQWADESSLVAVHGFAHLASSERLLLVCLRRPYPEGAPLRSLLAALDYRGAHRFDLEGLAVDEVAELAGAVAGAPPGKSVRRALEEAAGNPFYVSELIACLAREGIARVSEDGLLELTASGVTPSLRSTILEELRFLPEATVEVLSAASVVGRAFTVSDVALICPTSVADVAAALGPALQAGVVLADADRLCFRHDLIREAIYDDLVPAVRRVLHRELATRLADRGAAAELVAAQLMLGADRGDLEAAEWLRRAGSAMSAASPAIAARLLERALELAGDADDVRLALLRELVLPLLWTGQAARAEEVCSEALGAEPAAADAPLFWLGRVDARLLQGRFAETRKACREALAASDCLDESDRLHLASVHALAGVHLGDLEAVEEARGIVATAPPCIAKGTAQDAIAHWELLRGHADLAVDAFERVDAMRSPAALDSRIWGGSRIRVRMWHALALLDLDRLDEAAELLEREIAGKLAVPALPHAFLAACRYHAGRFDDAARECRAAIAAAEAAGSFVPASAPALAATIALRQARFQEAEELTTYAEQVRLPVEVAGDTIVRWTRTLLLEARGEIVAAADAAQGALERYQRAGFASYLAWHAPDLVRVALAANRPQQAEEAVLAAEVAAAQVPVASRRAGALRARALVNGETTVLLEAVELCRQVPRPLDLAQCLRDAAVALARAGRQADARPLALEAVSLLEGLRAVGEMRGAQAMLRAAGVRLGGRVKRAAASGWGSLTDGELRVVRLAVEGRSNQQIAIALHLSPRTVGWHLSNVFGKLGLSSRAELAAEAARRDLPA